MSLPANIIILILPFYKALADRLGRRLFLFINTIGMGMGMLICMVAPNIYIYIVGLLVIKFLFLTMYRLCILWKAPRNSTVPSFVL